MWRDVMLAFVLIHVGRMYVESAGGGEGGRFLGGWLDLFESAVAAVILVTFLRGGG